MEKIGIHFKNDSSGFNLSIFQLLKVFDFQNYIWEVNNAEVYTVDESNEITFDSLFKNVRYFITGDELQNIIENKKYYPIFLKLCAFSNRKPEKETIIQNAQDFFDSQCEFLLSIVDTDYITILCKDELLMDMLYKHVQRLGYVKVKYLTDENFGSV